MPKEISKSKKPLKKIPQLKAKLEKDYPDAQVEIWAFDEVSDSNRLCAKSGVLSAPVPLPPSTIAINGLMSMVLSVLPLGQQSATSYLGLILTGSIWPCLLLLKKKIKKQNWGKLT